MEKADVLEMTVTYLRAMQRKDTRTEGKTSMKCPKSYFTLHELLSFIKVNALFRIKNQESD